MQDWAFVAPESTHSAAHHMDVTCQCQNRTPISKQGRPLEGLWDFNTNMELQ